MSNRIEGSGQTEGFGHSTYGCYTEGSGDFNLDTSPSITSLTGRSNARIRLFSHPNAHTCTHVFGAFAIRSSRVSLMRF